MKSIRAVPWACPCHCVRDTRAVMSDRAQVYMYRLALLATLDALGLGKQQLKSKAPRDASPESVLRTTAGDVTAKGARGGGGEVIAKAMATLQRAAQECR